MAKLAARITLSVALCCPAFAADLQGIWMGQAPGRNAEMQDVAFQFRLANHALTGVMFGDEFDLPLENLKVDGDDVSFSVTATNYYSGSKVTMIYSGRVAGSECHLTRERKDPPAEPAAGDKPDPKQEITLKRVS